MIHFSAKTKGFQKDYTGPWGTCRTEKEKSTRAEINIAKIHFQLQRKREGKELLFEESETGSDAVKKTGDNK